MEPQHEQHAAPLLAGGRESSQTATAEALDPEVLELDSNVVSAEAAEAAALKPVQERTGAAEALQSSCAMVGTPARGVGTAGQLALGTPAPAVRSGSSHQRLHHARLRRAVCEVIDLVDSSSGEEGEESEEGLRRKRKRRQRV
jgi:hypothetical protein